MTGSTSRAGTPSDLNTELIVKTPPGYADATCDV